MWHPLNYKNFLLKFSQRKADFEIYLTDFINIWKFGTSIPDLIAIFKEENPLLEGKNDDIQTKILQLLINEKGIVQYDVQIKEKATLRAVIPTKNVEISLTITLSRGPPEMLYREFTSLLFGSITALVNHEKLLLDVIREKERELNEFRAEGFELKRSSVISPSFSQEHTNALSRQHMASQDDLMHNPVNFWNSAIKEYISFSETSLIKISDVPKVEIKNDVNEEEQLIQLDTSKKDVKTPTFTNEDVADKNECNTMKIKFARKRSKLKL